jgi:predicted Zn-ribbon and HTH transcriptional regulator
MTTTPSEPIDLAWGAILALDEKIALLKEELETKQLIEQRIQQAIEARDELLMSTPVKCLACGYNDKLGTYKPCLGVNDCRCPKCGSTNNRYNSLQMTKLSQNMKEKS